MRCDPTASWITNSPARELVHRSPSMVTSALAGWTWSFSEPYPAACGMTPAPCGSGRLIVGKRPRRHKTILRRRRHRRRHRGRLAHAPSRQPFHRLVQLKGGAGTQVHPLAHGPIPRVVQRDVVSSAGERKRLKHAVEVVHDAGVEPVHVDGGLLRGRQHTHVRVEAVDGEVRVLIKAGAPPRVRPEMLVVKVPTHEDHMSTHGEMPRGVRGTRPPRRCASAVTGAIAAKAKKQRATTTRGVSVDIQFPIPLRRARFPSFQRIVPGGKTDRVGKTRSIFRSAAGSNGVASTRL